MGKDPAEQVLLGHDTQQVVLVVDDGYGAQIVAGDNGGLLELAGLG
jgi:hypothetical protein